MYIKLFGIATAIFFTFASELQSQNASNSAYTNLPVRKYYAVSTTRTGSRYQVNGINVDKKTYQKYQSTKDSLRSCCPCILKTYDYNDVLIREAVQCTDCVVGYLKEFYQNGKIRVLAQYKENTTGDWANGHCYVEDGTWLYYNENGKITSIEKWKDGEFIEQKPKGKNAEIWRIDLIVNSQRQESKLLKLKDLESFEIIPRYKNEKKINSLTAIFEVGTIGGEKKHIILPLLEEISPQIKTLFTDFQNTYDENQIMTISILNETETLQLFNLEVEHK